jgi:hypothetical protein
MLIKFGKLEHIQKLYSEGELFLNTIRYFKKLEDIKLRGDRNENITQNLQPSETTVTINGHEIKDFAGPITFYIPEEDKYKFTHIYCMSLLSIGDKIVNKDRIFNEKIKEFGTHALIITNIKEFIFRLEQSLIKLNELGDIHYKAAHGKIRYLDLKTHHGDMDIFHKSDIFSFQKEWRVGIAFAKNINEAYSIKIGNMEDIAVIAESDDFFNGKIRVV